MINVALMKKVDAVFEGGGVRGIGLVGAAAVVEEAGYTFENVAGTSAGAIVACLIAAGYSTKELIEIMSTVDYKRFKDTSFFDRVPIVGPLASLVFEKGIYEGTYLETWLGDLLAKKGKKTFRDLVMPEYADDPRYRYRLQVIASDISLGKLLVLPRDAKDYGIEPDDLEIVKAVRMSMSIPFFYEPARLGKSYVVDGGVLSNFPVWLFDDGPEPEWPTFGFRLVDDVEQKPARIWEPVTFAVALVKTMLSAHDARYIQDNDFVRTIPVECGDVSAVDFGLSKETSAGLFQRGREAAKAFLADWDFERYKAGYRAQRQTLERGKRLRRMPPAER